MTIGGKRKEEEEEEEAGEGTEEWREEVKRAMREENGGKCQ